MNTNTKIQNGSNPKVVPDSQTQASTVELGENGYRRASEVVNRPLPRGIGCETQRISIGGYITAGVQRWDGKKMCSSWDEVWR